MKALLRKLFTTPSSDKKIMDVLGREVYLGNGVGYGFISNKYIYHNELLKVGFGRGVSGRGDWGGGFSRASTCPLWIYLDRNLVIRKLKTDSFYNSESSKEEERKAKKLMRSLKVGCKFIVQDPELKNALTKIFEIIPTKSNISWEVFKHSHMLKSHTKPECIYDKLEDANPNKVEDD